MTSWPEAYGRIVLSEVDSTLDEALRHAGDTPAPYWLLAHRQTRARGRRGRAWSMPEGNFAATLLMRPEENPARAALRSFVMSLALDRSLSEVARTAEPFSLKWPNDVLLNGGKVAGILLESGGAGGRLSHLAIGVGVNLLAAPSPQEVEPGALRPVSLLAETGRRTTAEDFLDLLAQHYAALETQFETFGFAPIREGWLARAARLGEVITARTGREEITGVFEDVDDEGHLVLRAPRGARRIAAADIFF